MDRTLTEYDPLTQTRDAWLALLAAVRDVVSQYRLLLAAGYGRRIADALQRNMNRGPAADKTGPRYAARFWAGAICAVIEQWVRSDLDAPEEELADVMTALMHRGVATAAEFGTDCTVCPGCE